MFLPSGEATEAVDVMEYVWTGRWPEVRSPQLKGLWLDGKTAEQNVRLSPGQNYPARVLAQTSAAVSLTYTFEIMEESGAQSTGGDFESAPRRLPGLVSSGALGEAQVKAPAKPGAYRLFAYVFNGRGKAAYGNIPFYVDAKTSAVASRP
jgi:hypothetical protein